VSHATFVFAFPGILTTREFRRRRRRRRRRLRGSPNGESPPRPAETLRNARIRRAAFRDSRRHLVASPRSPEIIPRKPYSARPPARLVFAQIKRAPPTSGKPSISRDIPDRGRGDGGGFFVALPSRFAASLVGIVRGTLRGNAACSYVTRVNVTRFHVDGVEMRAFKSRRILSAITNSSPSPRTEMRPAEPLTLHHA